VNRPVHSATESPQIPLSWK